MLPSYHEGLGLGLAGSSTRPSNPLRKVRVLKPEDYNEWARDDRPKGRPKNSEAQTLVSSCAAQVVEDKENQRLPTTPTLRFKHYSSPIGRNPTDYDEGLDMGFDFDSSASTATITPTGIPMDMMASMRIPQSQVNRGPQRQGQDNPRTNDGPNVWDRLTKTNTVPETTKPNAVNVRTEQGSSDNFYADLREKQMSALYEHVRLTGIASTGPMLIRSIDGQTIKTQELLPPAGNNQNPHNYIRRSKDEEPSFRYSRKPVVLDRKNMSLMAVKPQLHPPPTSRDYHSPLGFVFPWLDPSKVHLLPSVSRPQTETFTAAKTPAKDVKIKTLDLSQKDSPRSTTFPTLSGQKRKLPDAAALQAIRTSQQDPTTRVLPSLRRISNPRPSFPFSQTSPQKSSSTPNTKPRSDNNPGLHILTLTNYLNPLGKPTAANQPPKPIKTTFPPDIAVQSLNRGSTQGSRLSKTTYSDLSSDVDLPPTPRPLTKKDLGPNFVVRYTVAAPNLPRNAVLSALDSVASMSPTRTSRASSKRDK